MALMYYEGSSDYIMATPALIVTFEASGSITAGRGVCLEVTSGDSSVYMPAAIDSGALSPAGVAIATVSDGDPCPVLVWGFAKNLPISGVAVAANKPLVLSGSGLWTTSGSVAAGTGYAKIAGKVVSGSAASGRVLAFIDCMKTFI